MGITCFENILFFYLIISKNQIFKKFDGEEFTFDFLCRKYKITKKQGGLPCFIFLPNLVPLSPKVR